MANGDICSKNVQTLMVFLLEMKENGGYTALNPYKFLFQFHTDNCEKEHFGI